MAAADIGYDIDSRPGFLDKFSVSAALEHTIEVLAASGRPKESLLFEALLAELLAYSGQIHRCFNRIVDTRAKLQKLPDAAPYVELCLLMAEAHGYLNASRQTDGALLAAAAGAGRQIKSLLRDIHAQPNKRAQKTIALVEAALEGRYGTSGLLQLA